VLEGLATLMRGRTTILVTHSRRLAQTADRIVELADGRIATRATTASDPALPQLELLLDTGAMRDVLARSLDEGARLGDVRVGRVVYKPGETVAVHYRAQVDGERCDAVATSRAGVPLAERARKPRYRELARRAGDRSPGAPLSYDGSVGALITWLPFDPRLPALVLDGGELARRLGVAGGEPELIGYKPRSRAVLRLGEHVLKAYGTERQYEAALTGLMTAAREGPLPTAEFAAAVPELRLTAQRELPGTRPARAVDVAERAGALVATLQRAELRSLPAAPAARELAAAARKADVIRAVVPSLGPRLDALVRRLGERRPPDAGGVPAHGDFHADQLLLTDDGLAVIDFDEMCLAAPALDLATYAADVVRGRDGDLDEVHAVLEPLLAGYGGRPGDLDWHLAAAILGRAAHPFHRQVRDWAQRVEAMVAAAEAVSP
jgi:hypothetical protein